MFACRRACVCVSACVATLTSTLLFNFFLDELCSEDSSLKENECVSVCRCNSGSLADDTRVALNTPTPNPTL